MEAEACAITASWFRARVAAVVASCRSVMSTTDVATPSTRPVASSSRWYDADQACSSWTSSRAANRPSASSAV
ncbi:hypothetical protein SCANM63S_01318 [Streptomyces canarius]